jgi:asparagine synthetase B (glutamine-hydrolysing)
MAEGEPSWLVVFERRGEPGSPGAFRTSPSGWGVRLELGDQADAPAVAESEDVVVVFDGVMFDRNRLAAGLTARASARDSDDAALVLSGYLELGDRLLPRLRGSFGVVIWDGRRDRFLCARDPTGSHPVFFAHVDGRVLVAASQEALVATVEVPADFDRVAIAQWVLSSQCGPRSTFYSAVERLPPAHVLQAEPAGIRVERYWRPSETAQPGPTPKDAVEQFEGLLDQAVRRCASIGPLGVFLSGGADSGAVVSSATAVSRADGLPDPVALSYVMPHPDANEENTQRRVARGLGISQHIVTLDDALGHGGLLVSGLRLTERCPFPCVNPWEPIFAYLADEGARLGCRAILTGEGGNPWFEAERYEAADLLRHLRLAELRALWREERTLRSRRSVARNILWGCGGRLLAREVAIGLFDRPRGGIARKLRRRRAEASIPVHWVLPDATLREALVAGWAERSPSVRRRGSFREWGREEKLDGIGGTVYPENRFARARLAGVRIFDPPLDPDLVEFLISLPRAVMNLGGEAKGLARASVRSRAGESAAAGLGLAVTGDFFGTRTRNEAATALAELGGLPRLAGLGIVDERALVRTVRRDGFGGNPSYDVIWQAFACEAWLRGHT